MKLFRHKIKDKIKDKLNLNVLIDKIPNINIIIFSILHIILYYFIDHL